MALAPTIDPGTLAGLPLDGLDALNPLSSLQDIDLGPALLGGGSALLVTLLATPVTGALIASYAPRQPVKGAVLAVLLGIGSTVLAVGLAGAGAAATAANAQGKL